MEITTRQREVLSELLQGKSNKQIALSMGLSCASVSLLCVQLFRLFDVQSRLELVLKVLFGGMPSPYRADDMVVEYLFRGRVF